MNGYKFKELGFLHGEKTTGEVIWYEQADMEKQQHQITSQRECKKKSIKINYIQEMQTICKNFV